MVSSMAISRCRKTNRVLAFLDSRRTARDALHMAPQWDRTNVSNWHSYLERQADPSNKRNPRRFASISPFRGTGDEHSELRYILSTKVALERTFAPSCYASLEGTIAKVPSTRDTPTHSGRKNNCNLTAPYLPKLNMSSIVEIVS